MELGDKFKLVVIPLSNLFDPYKWLKENFKMIWKMFFLSFSKNCMSLQL